jgi:hypothetical protein
MVRSAAKIIATRSAAVFRRKTATTASSSNSMRGRSFGATRFMADIVTGTAGQGRYGDRHADGIAINSYHKRRRESRTCGSQMKAAQFDVVPTVFPQDGSLYL